MFAVLNAARKPPGLIAFVLSLVALAACVPATTGGGLAVNPDRPIPVALLVPGDSPVPSHAVIARSLENAARMAIADLDGARIDLRVYPTAGQPGRAAEAASQAVDDGARIILGPVFAEAANAAGLAVAGRNVNVLSFSNNAGIAGGNVFVLGNTFRNTADRLARFAVQQGKGDVMIVHGLDTAETIGRDAIAGAVTRAGGQVMAVASFGMSQTGLIDAIPLIAEEAGLSGAQSVFLTSGTDGALPLLTQLLKENGITPETTQYIGLRRWDIPASALALPGVQNGWFALPDPGLTARFNDRYTLAFGEPPHPIAGLAHDGIAAIGALAAAGRSDALTGAALSHPAGFVGVNGVFRLLPDGTNERALAVAMIEDGQVVIIDPAPGSFGGAGF